MTSIVGVLGLSGGMQGYFVSRCHSWERLLLIAGGLMLIDSGSMTDVIGVAFMAGVGTLQWIRRKNTVAAA